MRCATARELTSADADGEIGPAERRELVAHLAGCEACQRYADGVAALDRQVRVRPAEPVPDLVGAVMARARPARLGRGGWLRPAIAWVAAIMFVQSVPALVLGSVPGADTHVARHVGAFGMALAIGLAYVAWRPHRAFGLLPFTATLVATMLVAALFDTIDGGRTAAAELLHITELVGLTLLWMIAGSPGWRIRRRSSGSPSRVRRRIRPRAPLPPPAAQYGRTPSTTR